MATTNKNNEMAPKRVTDLDKDGIVTEREIELEIKLEKATAQRGIAIWALVALIGMAIFLVSPWAPVKETIQALDTVLSTFFVAAASIVGAYMGFTAWMSRK